MSHKSVDIALKQPPTLDECQNDPQLSDRDNSQDEHERRLHDKAEADQS